MENISLNNEPRKFTAPKIDTVPLVWKAPFGFEILKGESYLSAVKRFLLECESLGYLVRKIQVMDVLSIGPTPFLRLRVDLEDVEPVLRSCGRSYVWPAGTGWTAHFRTGKTGKVSASIMATTSRSGFGAIYWGPKILNWDLQFKE